MARNARYANPPAPDLQPAGPLQPKEMRRQEFARRVWALMTERNMNQAELARAAGLGRDSISGYVNGRNLPEPKSAKALADALGVTVPDLYPGAVEVAVDAEMPAIELRQIAGHPGQAWLRVNRKVPFSAAAKIIAIIEEADSAGGR